MEVKICEYCGKSFGLSHSDARIKYCKKCSTNRRYRKVKPSSVECPVCKTEFKSKNSLHKFCSKKCKDKFHSEIYQNKLTTNLKLCKLCGRKFSTVKTNKEYCSARCYDNAKLKRDRKRRKEQRIQNAQENKQRV